MGEAAPIIKGKLIRPEARIPRSMLSSKTRYSRTTQMLGREAVAHWNVFNQKLLKTFGLRIVNIEETQLKPARKLPGNMEILLSKEATLAAALPAAGLALGGRGDLLNVAAEQRSAHKKSFKEAADLRASATELEVLYSIVEKNAQIAFLVEIGEGAGDAGRRKPGEGLNASLYPGQLIVNRQYVGKTIQELERLGVNVCRIATDPIDGTTKTVMSEHSAITSILFVAGEISPIPDVYMEKLTVDEEAANSGLDTGESLEKIAQGLSDSHRLPISEITAFNLKRDRHPTEELLNLGMCVVQDSDGDLLPAVSPGARPGVYDNGRPIHAVLGNAGGAAEYAIAAAANQWAGGASHGRFVSATGMKKSGWDGRFDFTEVDRRIIEGAGFSLDKNYPISSLVDLSDGLAVFGGITSNNHFPQLSGAYLGDNFVQVDVIKIGASGRITKRRFVFEFMLPSSQIAERFSPVSEVLMKCDVKDIRGEMRKILGDSQRAERLHREIGLSLYQVFDIRDGKFEVNEAKLQELGDERTQAIITNLTELAPDWFV
jgi:fructose-1,6-bisphosphatase/sedoheptulose 1,7-bisphosphatase-like protein